MKVVIYCGTPTELAEFIARSDSKQFEPVIAADNGDTDTVTDEERQSNANAIANMVGILANLVRWHNEHNPDV